MEDSSNHSNFTSMPKGITLLQVLVALLVIAAFFIGLLYSKVEYLEKGGTPKVAAVPTQQVAPGQAAPAAPAVKADVAVGHFPIKGKIDAPVTIIEFADFRCPFCERHFSQTEPQIIKEYVETGKVKIAYRQYPFLGPASMTAANAAECANDQNKFWEMHDYLFNNQPPESDVTMYNTDTLTQAATTLGINAAKFRTCLDTKQFESKASADLADGQKAGVTGTPAFFINGTLLVGAQPFASFKTTIDAELAKK